MKLKVKGLVFVGFAAAVFAQSALAADGDNKIVTSKQYVDDKFQTLEKITTTSELTVAGNVTQEMVNAHWASNEEYPSMAVLKDVKDAVTSINVTGDDYINVTNNNGARTVSLDTADLATDSAAITSDSAAGDGHPAAQSKLVTASAVNAYAEAKANKLDGDANNNNTIASHTTDSTAYPSAKAVYDFVNGNYQAKANTGDTMYVGHNGAWRALETATTDSQAATDYVTLKWDSTNSVYQVNLDSGHIAATSALTGATPTNDSGLVTAGSIRSTILQAGSTTGGTISSAATLETGNNSDETVPTTKNVYEFVTNYASGTYQPKTTGTTVKVGYDGNWRELTVDSTYMNLDTTSGAAITLANVGHAGTDISGATAASAQSGTDKIASAYAVQAYVQSLLNGNNIPAPTGDCASIASDADGGCALVLAYYAAEGTTPAGVRLKWTKMSQ